MTFVLIHLDCHHVQRHDVPFPVGTPRYCPWFRMQKTVTECTPEAHGGGTPDARLKVPLVRRRGAPQIDRSY